MVACGDNLVEVSDCDPRPSRLSWVIARIWDSNIDKKDPVTCAPVYHPMLFVPSEKHQPLFSFKTLPALGQPLWISEAGSVIGLAW